MPTGGQLYACGGLTGLGPLAEAGQEEQLTPHLLQLEAGLGIRVVQIATGWAHSAFVTGTGNPTQHFKPYMSTQHWWQRSFRATSYVLP